MEMTETCVTEDGDDTCISIPRGGPIYVPNMIGPLTRVSDFESLIFNELQDLKKEISWDSTDISDEDISVDELKVITEEELVDKAFEVAFKDDKVTGVSSQLPEKHSNGGKTDVDKISGNEDACLESSERGMEAGPSNDSSDGSLHKSDENGDSRKNIPKERKRKRRTCTRNYALEDDKVTRDSSQLTEKNSNEGKTDDGKISSNEDACLESSERGMETGPSNDSSNESLHRDGENGDSRKNVPKERKRKRRTYTKNNGLEGSYMTKVKELARIKQKQDEDKAAARLHSFNGSCRINERATSTSYKTERVVSLKSTSSAIKTWSSSAREHVPVLYPETILCVEVYHSRRTWVKTQEFLVLGRQYLTELRDKIYCLTDHITKKAEQHNPSGYFLIEDVFCNDLREPSAIDYSKPIRDWLRDSKKEALEKWEWIISGELQQKKKSVFGSEPETSLPRFKAVEMHKTRFCDLRFRLGAGYLYCHQGDCKHLIVIRDMRLVNPEDVQNRATYPLVTFQAKVRFQKCSVCKIYRAEKVTVDDKWAAENPCYFCSLCHYMLHYVNKSLLYDEFSVYDHHHQ